MSQKSEKKAQETNQEPKEFTPKNITPPAEVKQGESTYTIDEFAKAPDAVGSNSPHLVRAALMMAGKERYTQAEAKQIVKTFSEKEVR